MIKTGEDAYFAASNSEAGFHSYYSECFEASHIGRIYAVKGGPGTGKSRFLRDVAEYATAKGSRCEYIYCSSDAASLDGVILHDTDRCTALIDATAPHSFEPIYPGVRDEIVNLGAFWDSDRLAARGEEIGTLNQRKKDAYQAAYRYLSGAGRMREIHEVLVRPYIREEAIVTLAERLMTDMESGETFAKTPALMRSIGMRGSVAFDTYFAEARSIFLVEDCYGAAFYLMQALLRLARQKRLRARVSYDPIHPTRIDGILLLNSRTVFAVARREECAYPFRAVRMRRFVDCTAMRPMRGEIRRVERLRLSMIEGAESALAKVRDAHFELERIYSEAMDFDAKEAFTKQFCARFI